MSTTKRTIQVDEHTRSFAHEHDITLITLRGSSMNAYEYQLNIEFIQQLTAAAQLKLLCTTTPECQNLIDAIGYGASCGIQANANRDAITATEWADFGWRVLDLTKAALEGGFLGLENTAIFMGNAFAHPIKTIKGILYCVADITSFIARATNTIIRLEMLEQRGYHDQLHAELTDIEDQIVQILNHCFQQLKNMPLREKVKHVAALGTETIATGKLFKVAYTLCSTMRPMVIQLLKLVHDEQITVEFAATGRHNLLLQNNQKIPKISPSGPRIIDKVRRPLVTTWIDVEALNRKFQGRVIVDGQSVHIDYEHLFSIEEMIMIKRTGHMTNPKLYGWHHDSMKALEKAGIVKHENVITNACGAFKSNPVVYDVRYGEKTFFPTAWTEEQVAEKIFEAFEGTHLSSIEDSTGCKIINGLTRCGLEIRMVYNPMQCMITTAFPIIK